MLDQRKRVPIKFMLKAIELTKQVQTSDALLQILTGVDLNVENGESVAIVGASGSGKSTLLGLLAGLDQATAGQVWINNTEMMALDEDGRAAVRKANVGFIFQNFQLVPGFTALENVMLPLELIDEPNANSKAKAFLEKVGLGERLNHYPLQMSGGEQQRVAIARAFAAEPHLLFADEPTGNLDQKTGHKIADLLFDLNRNNKTTLVLVTHDLDLAKRCDRVLELQNGKLVAA